MGFPPLFRTRIVSGAGQRVTAALSRSTPTGGYPGGPSRAVPTRGVHGGTCGSRTLLVWFALGRVSAGGHHGLRDRRRRASLSPWDLRGRFSKVSVEGLGSPVGPGAPRWGRLLVTCPVEGGDAKCCFRVEETLTSTQKEVVRRFFRACLLREESTIWGHFFFYLLIKEEMGGDL